MALYFTRRNGPIFGAKTELLNLECNEGHKHERCQSFCNDNWRAAHSNEACQLVLFPDWFRLITDFIREFNKIMRANYFYFHVLRNKLRPSKGVNSKNTHRKLRAGYD